LAAIGKGIASASGFSREPLSAAGIPGLTGGSSINLGGDVYREVGHGSFPGRDDPGLRSIEVNVHFEGDVNVRDDSDIDKIVEGIEDVFTRTQRGLGFAGAV